MTNIQKWFNENHQDKAKKFIYLKGFEINENLQGAELTIDGFNQTNIIHLIDLPHLRKIIIKDCGDLETLEYFLENEVEIVIVGSCSKLKNIRSKNNQKNVVLQPQEKKGLDLPCIFSICLSSLSLITCLTLAYFIYKKKKARKY